MIPLCFDISLRKVAGVHYPIQAWWNAFPGRDPTHSQTREPVTLRGQVSLTKILPSPLELSEAALLLSQILAPRLITQEVLVSSLSFIPIEQGQLFVF
jgi:hypothetical protein